MLGTTDQQILKTVYTWGCEMPKAELETQLQIIIHNELNGLRQNGMIHVNGPAVCLTSKGAEFVELQNLVPIGAIQRVQGARGYVKKALRSVLEHDVTGYNVAMQEARKTYPTKFISSIERFFWSNIP